MRVDFDFGISAHVLEATLHTVGLHGGFLGSIDPSSPTESQTKRHLFSLPLIAPSPSLVPPPSLSLGPRRPQRRRFADGEEITVKGQPQGRARSVGHLHLGHYPAARRRRWPTQRANKVQCIAVITARYLERKCPETEEGGLTRGGLLQNIKVQKFRKYVG